MDNFEARLRALKESLPGNVRIVAVSKTKPVSAIQEAYQAGQRIFGENKVQEILAKSPELPADIEWHLIGHLQTNKVKQIVPIVSMIHSVDSVRLMNKIQHQAATINKVMSCLLQVHIAREESKYGFSPDELLEWFEQMNPGDYPNICFAGLMGMASFSDDQDLVRSEFAVLSKLFEKIKSKYFYDSGDFRELSMGMTGDYPIAVEEGSTLIRVGTLLFGSRLGTSQA